MKKKSDKNTKTLKEELGTRMVSEVYPEIFKMLKEIGDININVTLESIGKIAFNVGTTSDFHRHDVMTLSVSSDDFLVINKGVAVDKCPIALKNKYDFMTYIKICDASIATLELLRKTKIEFSKMLDKIDALPSKLERKVITEKLEV